MDDTSGYVSPGAYAAATCATASGGGWGEGKAGGPARGPAPCPARCYGSLAFARANPASTSTPMVGPTLMLLRYS